MDIRQITDDFYAAPQIDPDDVAEIADAGFTCVICNRPDTEVPPSHRHDVMKAAVQEAGLRFVYIPLTHQTLTADNIAQNHAAIRGADGPVLAYCASGTRSTIAWALGTAGTLPSDEIVKRAAAGGYDLRGLMPTLQALASQAKSG